MRTSRLPRARSSASGRSDRLCALLDSHQSDRDDRPIVRESVVARLKQVLIEFDHLAIDVERDLHHALAIDPVALAAELDEALCVRPGVRGAGPAPVVGAARRTMGSPVLTRRRVPARGCGHHVSSSHDG